MNLQVRVMKVRDGTQERILFKFRLDYVSGKITTDFASS